MLDLECGEFTIEQFLWDPSSQHVVKFNGIALIISNKHSQHNYLLLFKLSKLFPIFDEKFTFFFEQCLVLGLEALKNIA